MGYVQEMVRQISAGYSVAGRLIKVPQTFIPRVARTTILARTVTDSKQLNQLHFLCPVSPVTLANVQAINAMVDAWIPAFYRNCFADTIHTLAVHTRSMEALVVPQDTIASSHFGSIAGDLLAYNTTMAVELTTGLTGAENSGEFFCFTATEAVNDANGFPTDAYRIVCENALNQLALAATAAGFPLIVASYTYQEFKEVTTCLARRQWGSQRRRLTQYGS